MSRIFRRLSSSLRSLSMRLGKSEACNVVVVGLDNSGKSTMINHLQQAKAEDDEPYIPEEVAPTVGFRVETFRRKNVSFTAYDMSGQGRYRNLWAQHYTEIHAIVFVIDATDRMRLCVARDELEMVLDDPSVRSRPVPILFLCNKKDCADAMGPAECVAKMELEKIRERPWSIISTNARNGDGIEEAIEWLADSISFDSSSASIESKHK
ncbi:ADP-ribosylation factor [Hondaea fermentalgiana]|uniref:ADP-ribosylation factor n=1 Tax=Hondaea fermentalgiana TaxID=2315210 RepID=A0A2R5GD78_9STRA|nr:ADP-ribosylation factor [Hondaea fermentalgiana]|eukprot:GBG28887.1 ADP-ribosylation factor [Hondaea fermentalgiana]